MGYDMIFQNTSIKDRYCMLSCCPALVEAERFNRIDVENAMVSTGDWERTGGA